MEAMEATVTRGMFALNATSQISVRSSLALGGRTSSWLVRPMRTMLLPLILVSCICPFKTDAATDELQPKVDAYIAQVGGIVRDALMPELAEHRELGDVIKEFSFSIDAAGHPKEIRASTTPPTEFLDKLVIRVIRGLKFPPIPKEILEKYPEIEFPTRMGAP